MFFQVNHTWDFDNLLLDENGFCNISSGNELLKTA